MLYNGGAELPQLSKPIWTFEFTFDFANSSMLKSTRPHPGATLSTLRVLPWPNNGDNSPLWSFQCVVHSLVVHFVGSPLVLWVDKLRANFISHWAPNLGPFGTVWLHLKFKCRAILRKTINLLHRHFMMALFSVKCTGCAVLPHTHRIVPPGMHQIKSDVSLPARAVLQIIRSGRLYRTGLVHSVARTLYRCLSVGRVIRCLL